MEIIQVGENTTSYSLVFIKKFQQHVSSAKLIEEEENTNSDIDILSITNDPTLSEDASSLSEFSDGIHTVTEESSGEDDESSLQSDTTSENSLQSDTTSPEHTSSFVSVLSPARNEAHYERCLRAFSAALDSSFTNSVYNIWPQNRDSFQVSDRTFFRESGLLQYMNMLVPLHSPEAAWCSRNRVFEYVPLHVRDPAWNLATPPFDFVIPSRQLRDLNDSSIPDHVRKGVDYDDSDPIEYIPEVIEL